MRAQRTAVVRLPARVPAGAGGDQADTREGRRGQATCRTIVHARRPARQRGMLRRIPTTDYLIAQLRDARRRTLTLIKGLDDTQLMGPRLPIVNPLRWEIGHVAYFGTVVRQGGARSLRL